jgi:hypothetical protein
MTNCSSERPPIGALLEPVVKKSSFFFSSRVIDFTWRKRQENEIEGLRCCPV